MAALDKAAAASKPLKAEGVRSYRGGMGVRAEPARRVSRPLRFHPYVRPAHETPTRPACSPLYDIPIPAILPGSRFHMGLRRSCRACIASLKATSDHVVPSASAEIARRTA